MGDSIGGLGDNEVRERDKLDDRVVHTNYDIVIIIHVIMNKLIFSTSSSFLHFLFLSSLPILRMGMPDSVREG